VPPNGTSQGALFLAAFEAKGIEISLALAGLFVVGHQGAF
jgi:hypothetical protein